MTNEECRLICEYMGWDEDNFFKGYRTLDGHAINFDLNDAGLVVQEMQKRGEWEQFHDFVIEWGDLLSKASFAYITAWLMSMEEGQAKNFFKDFCEWRKGK